MTTLSIVRRNYSEHRTDGFALQLVTFDELVPGERLHAKQHIFQRGNTCCDLGIAVLTRVNDQAMRADRPPELLVVHGCEPVFNIFDCLKFFHGLSVSNQRQATQILSRK